jgi:hypothetical protein
VGTHAGVGVLLGVGAAAVYLPMAVGVGFGAMLGGTVAGDGDYSTAALLVHNLVVGLFTAAAGLLTFGVLALVSSCWGGFVNGYGMGVVLAENGAVDLVRGLAHFVPETAAFVCFTAVGSAPAVRMVCRNLLDADVGRLRDAIRTWLVLAVVGAALLALAAPLEAWTGPGEL